MKKCLLLVALAACLAVEADAATLTIEDVTVVEGTNTATIRVFASGGESITAFSAPLLIAGDGGGAIGGSDLPNEGGFIAGSFDTSFGLMTNAGGNYDSFVGETLSAGTGLLADPSFGNFFPGSSFVDLDGSELFRFDVDVSGLSAGDSQSYTFDFDSLIAGAPSFDLFGGGQVFAVNGGGGSVTIAPVPSPTGVAGLLSLGLVGLGSGLRRRRGAKTAATAA